MKKFYKLYQEVMTRRDIGAAAKLVYAVIVDAMRDHDKAWPGTRALSQKTGLARQTVINAINQIESKKLLAITRRGRGQTNWYQLPLEGLESRPVQGEQSGQESGQGGQESSPQVVKNLGRNRQTKEIDYCVRNTTTIDNHKRKRAKASSGRFVKPTVEQVRAYAQQIGFARLSDDPQYFLDKNDSIGWVVGRNKTPMRDWRAAMRIWQKNESPGRAGGDTSAVKNTEQTHTPAPSHNKNVMAGEILRPLTETEKMLFLTPRIIE